MPQYNQKATIELFESIEEQAAEKVVRALNHGGDPNGTDEEDRKFGITPMHSACMGQKTDILRLLVTYGGKVRPATGTSSMSRCRPGRPACLRSCLLPVRQSNRFCSPLSWWTPGRPLPLCAPFSEHLRFPTLPSPPPRALVADFHHVERLRQM